MDVQLNNQTFNSGPETLDPSFLAAPSVRDEPGFSASGANSMRANGSRLAEADASSRTKGVKEPVDKSQGLNFIESLWNGGKKFSRKVCLVGGWASASAAIVSVLVLNIKSLAVLFGIPAALFLYTASTLGRDIKTDPTSGVVKDPLNSLKHILEKHPEALRDDPKFVINTIQAITYIKKNDPRYYEVMDRLGALEESILMEQAILRNKEDPLSLAYMGQMKDYLNEIRKLERI
jgi:hypothetical protein